MLIGILSSSRLLDAKQELFVFLVEESSVTINSLWDPVLAVSKDKAC